MELDFFFCVFLIILIYIFIIHKHETNSSYEKQFKKKRFLAITSLLKTTFGPNVEVWLWVVLKKVLQTKVRLFFKKSSGFCILRIAAWSLELRADKKYVAVRKVYFNCQLESIHPFMATKSGERWVMLVNASEFGCCECQGLYVVFGWWSGKVKTAQKCL